MKKALTNIIPLCIITFAPQMWQNSILAESQVRTMEKYSRGRRGAPAKGVGRATGARVQIPLSPLTLPSISAVPGRALLIFIYGEGSEIAGNGSLL